MKAIFDLSAELVVWYKGKEVLLLNKKLLDQQNCWENLQLIKDLHLKRLELEELMSAVGNPHVLVPQWEEIQFQLQDAWKFERDSRFHRFWTIPTCECPKMDNEDSYPTILYAMTTKCPIHGWDRI